MYHAVMSRKLTDVFHELNRGNFEPVMEALAPTFTHEFVGEHFLSGRCARPSTYRRWFERLFEVFPDINFTVHNIDVEGPPWDTRVTIEWTNQLTTLDGVKRTNRGAHFMRFSWTKATEIQTRMDAAKLAECCAIQAAHGVTGATAAPLLDSY